LSTNESLVRDPPEVYMCMVGWVCRERTHAHVYERGSEREREAGRGREGTKETGREGVRFGDALSMCGCLCDNICESMYGL